MIDILIFNKKKDWFIVYKIVLVLIVVKLGIRKNLSFFIVLLSVMECIIKIINNIKSVGINIWFVFLILLLIFFVIIKIVIIIKSSWFFIVR